MSASLEGPLAKLTRAEQQLRVLKDEVEAIWPPREPWPVETEPDRNGLEYRFYLGELPGVEPCWGLLAGEIMFDLRSTLDHLAYQLHVRRYRGSLPDTVEHIPMFPIFDEKPLFRRYGKPRIRLLSQRDQRAIKWLQPYVARRDQWGFVRPDLSYLDALHNIDKHRRLHVVAASHGSVVIPPFPKETGFRQQVRFGAVESHSHIETWTFTNPPADIEPHAGASLQVAVEDRGNYYDLEPLLAQFVDSVATVLARFSDRFPPTFQACRTE